jgi:hypothetical protein
METSLPTPDPGQLAETIVVQMEEEQCTENDDPLPN